MALTARENWIATVARTNPEWIPGYVLISNASRNQLRGEVEEVMARHPVLYPDFVPGQVDWDSYDFGAANTEGEPFTDNWGCVWESAVDGLEGQVLVHPLADWEALETWRPPDPHTQEDRGPADWEGARRNAEAARARGELVSGGLGHGFMLMRLWYLRGFENLMLDIATDEPRLQTLIDLVVENSRVRVQQWLDIGMDVMSFPEDLGTQTASIISPAKFHKWITPAYTKLMEPCHAAGVYVTQHSDGYVMELIDEFIEAGRDVINLQDLCNGIDNIAAVLKGRVCIDLDIDRQRIVPFGTRQEIRDLIEEEVRKLGSPQGGLMFTCGIYPPTPPENIDAVCSALEEFRTYWW